MTENKPEFGLSQETQVAKRVERLLAKINAEALRVKELGGWPGWVEVGSLAERVPGSGDVNAPGFDAGIACALDLFVREKQKLAAILHGAYTPESVAQVREEIKNMDSDSETCWWLAACSICVEGGVGQSQFLKQIKSFEKLASDSQKRKEAAQKEFNKMTSTFHFLPEFGSAVPYGTEDGCMQGAYIAGYPFAVNYNEKYGLYFIGTYHPSLGLEKFPWSDEKDEKGRLKSGPVFGSKQFVKCASKEELQRVLDIVKPKFATEAGPGR